MGIINHSLYNIAAQGTTGKAAVHKKAKTAVLK